MYFKSIEGLTPQELLDIKYAVYLMCSVSESKGLSSCPWYDLYNHLKETPSELHDDDHEFIKAHIKSQHVEKPASSSQL